MKILVTKDVLDHNFDMEEYLKLRRLKVVSKNKGVWHLGAITIYEPPDDKKVREKECEIWECEGG